MSVQIRIGYGYWILGIGYRRIKTLSDRIKFEYGTGRETERILGLRHGEDREAYVFHLGRVRGDSDRQVIVNLCKFPE